LYFQENNNYNFRIKLKNISQEPMSLTRIWSGDLDR